jgi:uncharacterized protein
MTQQQRCPASTTLEPRSSLVADGLDFGPINLAVIQPTSFCNLNCNYCYLPDREVRNTLSLDLIEPIFQALLTSRFLGEVLPVCWHAGEPLSLPLSFYETAFERIAKASDEYNTKQVPILHSFQTNATYINQDWCDFIKQHQITIGVSVDGPAFLHDRQRVTRKGTGSHAATLRGIAFLKTNEIPFYTISVITRDSLEYADEIFRFFVENEIDDIAFNLEETEGVHQRSTLSPVELEGQYQLFMERFWDLCNYSGYQVKLREFEQIGELIYSGGRLNHTDMNHPFAIVNFDYQGNFSTFDPELLSVKTDRYEDFVLGNVLRDSLDESCWTAKFQHIYQDIKQGVEQCRQTCEYFGVCGGGAGSNKYWENGRLNSTQTMACRYRTQIPTDILINKLEGRLGVS